MQHKILISYLNMNMVEERPKTDPGLGGRYTNFHYGNKLSRRRKRDNIFVCSKIYFETVVGGL